MTSIDSVLGTITQAITITTTAFIVSTATLLHFKSTLSTGTVADVITYSVIFIRAAFIIIVNFMALDEEQAFASFEAKIIEVKVTTTKFELMLSPV